MKKAYKSPQEVLSSFKDERFLGLVFKYLDQHICPDESEELQQKLKEDKSCRDVFVALLIQFQQIKEAAKRTAFSMHLPDSISDTQVLDGLRDAAVEDYDLALKLLSQDENIAIPIEIPREMPHEEISPTLFAVHEKRKIINRFHIVTFLATAAVILLLMYLKYVPPKPWNMEVATLTDQMDVQWANNGPQPRIGDRLWSNGGLFDLKKGYVKIRYDNGVDLLVEAPALFQIERGGIYVEYGRLYGGVTEAGLGFRVETPTSQFIDQGTEFGVHADVNGSSELHVVKGKVQLFAGSKGESKTARMVTENKAIRYNANSFTIDEIPIQKQSFARYIDSKTKTVWRGETAINLADIVGGGNGFNSGRRNAGVDVSTGKPVSDLLEDGVKVGPVGYQTVDSSPFIDGVFVPGLEDGMTPITADRSIAVEFPRTSGNYWGYIVNGAFHKGEKVPRHTLRLNGVLFGVPDNPSITIHSNQGITFDLLQIRQSLPDMNIKKFRSLVGISETAQDYGTSTADVWVLLDGRKVYAKQMLNSDRAVEVEIPLSADDRYLTLAVTEADSGWAFDWTLFGRPELIIEPTR